MTERVSLDRDGDGRLVAAKRAHDAAGRARVDREARVLAAAGHPGVVSLVDATPGFLRTRWVGTALSTLLPVPPDRAAAIVAAVAATVGDLHEAGVVHGRIGPSHVLVGPTGRPVLCGFGDAAAPGEPPATDAPTPPDDVAALGRLLHLMVAGGPDAEPIPERRFANRRDRRRATHLAKCLRNLADHASADDPTRRPTARAFAAALHAAAPDARLEPLADRTLLPSARPSISADRHRRDDPDPRTKSVPQQHETSHDPRPEPALAPQVPVDPDPGTKSVAQGHETSHDPRLDPAPAAGGPLGPVADPSARAALHDSDRNPGTESVAQGHETSHGSRQLPRPGGAEPAGWRGRGQAVVGAAALVALVVAAGAVVTSSRSRGSEPTLVRRTATAPAAPRRATTSTTLLAGCPTVSQPAADVDGDGCPDAVRVAGNTVQAGAARFEVGEPDDAVFVGDWDCDGVATPAAVRGEAVYLFTDWARDTDVVVPATYTVPGGGHPSVRHTGRCDQLVLDTPSGPVPIGGHR